MSPSGIARTADGRLEKEPALRPSNAVELRKTLLACEVPSWALRLGAA